MTMVITIGIYIRSIYMTKIIYLVLVRLARVGSNTNTALVFAYCSRNWVHHCRLQLQYRRFPLGASLHVMAK